VHQTANAAIKIPDRHHDQDRDTDQDEAERHADDEADERDPERRDDRIVVRLPHRAPRLVALDIGDDDGCDRREVGGDQSQQKTAIGHNGQAAQRILFTGHGFVHSQSLMPSP
jgi:hypothetical protein